MISITHSNLININKGNYFIVNVILIILFSLCSVTDLKSQDFFTYTDKELILDNEVVNRVMQQTIKVI